MSKKCNCKAERNLQQLKTFLNRGKDEEGDSLGTKVEKHVLRILGNIAVIVTLPIAVPLVLLQVRRNMKNGLGRVFKFNTNRWKAYINHEVSNYKPKEAS